MKPSACWDGLIVALVDSRNPAKSALAPRAAFIYPLTPNVRNSRPS